MTMSTVFDADVMGILKESTMHSHKSIETHMPVMKPGFTLAEYQALLHQLYRFYVHHEQQLATLAEKADLEMNHRLTKSEALRRDLENLGVEPPVPGFELRSPLHQTPATQLGALYVTEGATLGGQIITKHLQKTLNLQPHHGLWFFSGYGLETGRMWQKLGQSLRIHLSEPAQIEEAVASANATFKDLESFLKKAI